MNSQLKDLFTEEELFNIDYNKKLENFYNFIIIFGLFALPLLMLNNYGML